MKISMKVTSVNKLTDDSLQVQLQGKNGHASLNLPISQQKAIQVGDEWTLEHDTGVQAIGEPSKTVEKKKPSVGDSFRDAALGALSGKTDSGGGLDALSGKPKKP